MNFFESILISKPLSADRMRTLMRSQWITLNPIALNKFIRITCYLCECGTNGQRDFNSVNKIEHDTFWYSYHKVNKRGRFE